MNEVNHRTDPSTHVLASDVTPEGAMSTPETLSSIFFEPGRVFESFRQRPRFLMAGLVMIALSLVVTFLVFRRVGAEVIFRSAIEHSPQGASLTPEQMDAAVAMWTGPFGTAMTYGGTVIGFAAAIAAGAALYLLGSMLMGKPVSYKQALSVWVYSSFAPAVISVILNILLLYLKSPDDIDPVQINRGRGLVQANPSLLVDTTAHPALGTALGSLDLFAFYGLYLAALGLRKVGRMSAGGAWTVVLGLWLIMTLVRVGWMAAFAR